MVYLIKRMLKKNPEKWIKMKQITELLDLKLGEGKQTNEMESSKLHS